jgi:6-phosphogluconolactonase
MPPEIIVDHPGALANALATLLERESRRAVAERGLFSIALTGGSVAEAFFPRLARVPFDWSRTEVFWGDERAVPPSDPASNYGRARGLWLEPAGAPPERLHRMEGEAPDLAAAAESHAGELVRLLGAPPRLDLALLGVGPDGHVCSLFPGHPLLREERRWVAAIEDAPKPPPRRLTLTLPTLAAARLVVVAALGSEKAPPLREALEDPESMLPVALVTRRAPRVVYLLDPDAGRRARGPA